MLLLHSAATKLYCRLVPGQDRDAVFETIREHLESINPVLDVTNRSLFHSMNTPADNPAARPIRQALKETRETEPTKSPVRGGSLPVAYTRNIDAISTVAVSESRRFHDQRTHLLDGHLTVECFQTGLQMSVAVIRAVTQRWLRFRDSVFTVSIRSKNQRD